METVLLILVLGALVSAFFGVGVIEHWSFFARLSTLIVSALPTFAYVSIVERWSTPFRLELMLFFVGALPGFVTLRHAKNQPKVRKWIATISGFISISCSLITGTLVFALYYLMP